MLSHPRACVQVSGFRAPGPESRGETAEHERAPRSLGTRSTLSRLRVCVLVSGVWAQGPGFRLETKEI